jgi:hypothetical protein
MEQTNDFVTIVAGLPRSGTSMMMNCLHKGGLNVLVDNLRKPDEDNPLGYFEYEPVKKTKQDPSWLKNAPGKVVKMVYRLLYDLPAGYEYRVIFMQRDMAEVLASQKKMLDRSQKSAAEVSDEQMAALYQSDLQKFFHWIARQPHFKMLIVNHRDMLNHTREQCEKISHFLGGRLDVENMIQTVNPLLYRNRNQ